MPRRGPGRGESIACIGAILAISGGLALWQRTGYWEFSDGVYAESARLILRGLVPYRDFAAAQPPLTYYVPALLLCVHDSVWTLRVALGLLDALTALLTAYATWRLTRSRGLALLGGSLAQLLPITLHEHAQAVPETFAAACLLAGCLAGGAGPPRGFRTVLLGAAVMFKFAFIVPALLIAASVTHRARAVATLLGVIAALIAASILLSAPICSCRRLELSGKSVGRAGRRELGWSPKLDGMSCRCSFSPCPSCGRYCAAEPALRSRPS